MGEGASPFECMKKVFGIIGTIAACAVVLPLIFGLLFAFPIEFAAATWHVLRVDSTTEGVITKSEVRKSRKGMEGSSMTYSYEVGGHRYVSSRRSGGYFANSSNESGGGKFARDHPVGSEVKVYFDASDPGFSMLERGWPKWSIGFSVGVWGLWFSNYFKRTDQRTIRLMFAYPLSRAAPICAFITIMFFPVTVDGSGLIDFLSLFAVISLLAFGWLMLGKPDSESTVSIQS